jgi:putative ABC transport system substrate-binding protein
MRRRQFIAGLGGAALVGPLAADAQQASKTYRIGVVGGATAGIMVSAFQGFRDELRRAGFNEGQNLTIDWRPGNQDASAFSADIAEMVRSKVDVIISLGSEPALQAAVAGTSTIPIVISANNYDPIARGYVKSLAQPGGNVTGMFLRQTELAEKQVELLTQAFPDKTRLAVLWDEISAYQFGAADSRAKALRLEVHAFKLKNPPYDVAAAFRTLAEGNPQMLLILSSPFFGPHTQQVVDLTNQYRWPAMFIFRRYVELGGLMSYGADNVAMYRQTATYVAKILRGAKPADLPVEQPTKFELAVNLKTAKMIRVELPTAILLRADEVLE